MNQRLFHGILLVAGTSIGGGMLALPVLTSLGGFKPSLLIYASCWLFMMTTGLLFIEISSWMKEEANILTMAEKTLGKGGKLFAWILYLFLFYCLTLAYMVGSGNLFSEFASDRLTPSQGTLLFLILFAPFVYLGTSVISRLNVYLMIGLAASYAMFVWLGVSNIQVENLQSQNWSLSVLALPVSFTAFAFQGIIPTLITYLKQDYKQARTAVIVGSFIPLIAYVIWQGLILGIVPAEGPYGLQMALSKGDNAIQPLKYFIENPKIYVVGQSFAFFALVTSFFGVSLGLKDFLADGLRMEQTARNKIILCILIFTPPLIVSMFYPHLFLKALGLAGGIGCALLLGFLPVLMVWSGRYHKNLAPGAYRVPGGRLLLASLFLFVFFELACEVFEKCFA